MLRVVEAAGVEPNQLLWNQQVTENTMAKKSKMAHITGSLYQNFTKTMEAAGVWTYSMKRRKATLKGGLFVSSAGASVGVLAHDSQVHLTRNSDAAVGAFVPRLWTVDNQHIGFVLEHSGHGLA
jgi:hypothetical protein